jgi:hypothetical protein
MEVIKAPTHWDENDERQFVFLSGSIEMGTAPNWQDRVIEGLKGQNVVILNPRRDDWDSSWIQSIDNPQFYEQVTWELDAMDVADFIIMHFEPGTNSPITLLELGLCAPDPKELWVHCPEGFWRKGNVDIVCAKYKVPQYDTMDEILERVRARITAP